MEGLRGLLVFVVVVVGVARGASTHIHSRFDPKQLASITNAWARTVGENNYKPREDINGNGLRDERVMTRMYVKNPEKYWSPGNRPNYRAPPVWATMQTLGWKTSPHFKNYRSAHNPPTHVRATNKERYMLHKEAKFTGEWLGVGANLPVPRTGMPAGYVSPDKAAAAAANAGPGAAGAGASFRQLPVRRVASAHHIIKIPRRLQRAAAMSRDPSAAFSLNMKPPKMAAPPPKV